MPRFSSFLAFLSLSVTATHAFSSYGSLAGLSERELDKIMPTLRSMEAKLEFPPGPLNFTGTKLVNDAAHPWRPAGKDDQRGPCPGLNTLASHGYLPRNGIATPAQIVAAAQEGFNMGNDLAIFTTYAAFIVDGNLITNLVSIGGKSSKTGPNPPAPAIVGGLDTHAVFEGDASTTRADAFFGDNHSFNETLFQEFVSFSNKLGGGFYNVTVASEFRYQRILDSIATNPQFSFNSPRSFTAYAESVFPIAFFVDGRNFNGQLDMKVARGFFQDSRMPDGFHRANESTSLGNIGARGLSAIFLAHPIQPGANNGTINSYTPNPNSAKIGESCKLYTDFVNQIVRSLYPNAKGALLKALNHNLDIFYTAQDDPTCPQVPHFT